MTKEDALTWVFSLKRGDKVIYTNSIHDTPIGVLTVKNVTPTGIVRTEENESFCQNRYSSSACVSGYGKSIGRIVPYDDNLAVQAAEYQRKHRIQKENEATIRRAEYLCYELSYHKRRMSLAMAKKIVQMVEDEEKEKEKHGMAE